MEEGTVLDVELLSDKKEGDAVSFDKVLMISNKEELELGTPYIKDAKVLGKLISIGKDKKVVTFKFKRKTNYHRTIGHRQNYSRIKIESLGGKA